MQFSSHKQQLKLLLPSVGVAANKKKLTHQKEL